MEPEPEDYLCYGLTEQALPDLMAFMDGHPSLSALHDYLRARGHAAFGRPIPSGTACAPWI